MGFSYHFYATEALHQRNLLVRGGPRTLQGEGHKHAMVVQMIVQHAMVVGVAADDHFLIVPCC